MYIKTNWETALFGHHVKLGCWLEVFSSLVFEFHCIKVRFLFFILEFKITCYLSWMKLIHVCYFHCIFCMKYKTNFSNHTNISCPKIYVVDFNNVRTQILSKWLLIYYFSKSKKLLINERHFLFRYHLSFSFLFFLPPLYVSYMMAYYYSNSYIYVWHWDLSILFSTCQMQWVGAIITSVY